MVRKTIDKIINLLIIKFKPIFTLDTIFSSGIFFLNYCYKIVIFESLTRDKRDEKIIIHVKFEIIFE